MIRAYRFRILMMFVNKICVYSIEPFYTKDYISCIFTFKGYVLILFQYFLKSHQYFTRGHKENAIGGLSTVEWFLQKVWICKINLHKRNKNIHLKKVGPCWHFILFVRIRVFYKNQRISLLRSFPILHQQWRVIGTK